MKATIVIVILAVAAGLYLVFSHPSASLTGPNLQSLTPAQLLALSPTQVAQLTPSQQATIAALRSNPSNYASNLFLSPSPIQNNAGVLTAGINTIGAAIGAIGKYLNAPAVGSTQAPTTTTDTFTGVTTGPTYQQAGILPDLPLTAPSPSLMVPLNGDPAVIDSGGLSSGIDYPGIQTYMTDPTSIDTNAYDGTGGAFFS